MLQEAIGALATAQGKSGIAVIRVSGHDAIERVTPCFKGPDLTKVLSHTVHYGYIINPNHEIIDEVLISVFRAPRSFTGDDTVEISCHGGMMVVSEVLKRLYMTGIRPAEPGEFSKRAFLNGRIDLIQAEAVMELIEAKNARALKAAHKALQGETSLLVSRLRQRITDLLAILAVNIDYPEYDDAEVMTRDTLTKATTILIKELDAIIEASQKTRLLTSGVKTAIIGRPNVGKSSLLNVLLNEERAIVTDIAGTTRDTVEGYVNIGGITLNLIDTAGIHKTTDRVEQIGVERAKKALNDAELVLLVLDGSAELSEADLDLMALTEHKTRIIVVNKIDLQRKILVHDDHVLFVSAQTKAGFAKLETTIKDVLGLHDFEAHDDTVMNMRQIAGLINAKNALDDTMKTLHDAMPVDMAELDLQQAWQALSDLLGERSKDALMDALFSQFCLGK